MFKKAVWLIAGLLVGVGLSSSFANSRTPASYQFKVVAVSVEDAAEKAAEMMKDGELRSEIETTGLLSASLPRCSESGSAYACETNLTYRE
jgi:hypothetical protein